MCFEKILLAAQRTRVQPRREASEEAAAVVKAAGLGVQKWTGVERPVLGDRAEKDLMKDWAAGRRRQGFGWRVTEETPHTSKVVHEPWAPTSALGKVVQVRLPDLGSRFGPTAERSVHGDGENNEEGLAFSADYGAFTSVPTKALERP